MKNRIINYSLISIFFLCLVFACTDDILEESNEDNSKVGKVKEFSIDDAHEWFLKTYGNPSQAKLGDDTGRDINWKRGIKKRVTTTKEIIDVVIFPVKIKSKKDILEDASLWVINGTDGIFSKYLDFYNADFRKMDKKTSKNQYKNAFNGCLNISDVKSGLEIGHYYESGKIAGVITSFNGEKSSLIEKKKGAKTNWCFPRYVCPDVSGSISYVSASGVATVTIGHCATIWSCEQYFIYNGDPSLDDIYWDYFWQNVANSNKYNISDINSLGLSNPCLLSLTNCVAGANLKNSLQNMFDKTYVQNGGDVNLVFTENPNMSVPGRFMGNNGQRTINSNIQLNPALISGKAFEFGVSIVIHETVHAIMEIKGMNTNNPVLDHESEFSMFFDLMVDALVDGTGISRADAGALTLNGFASVLQSNPNLFNQKAQPLGLTVSQVSSTAYDYKNNLKGSPCN